MGRLGFLSWTPGPIILVSCLPTIHLPWPRALTNSPVAFTPSIQKIAPLVIREVRDEKGQLPLIKTVHSFDDLGPISKSKLKVKELNENLFLILREFSFVCILLR